MQKKNAEILVYMPVVLLLGPYTGLKLFRGNAEFRGFERF